MDSARAALRRPGMTRLFIPRALQMLQHAGAERGLLLRGPLAKTLAGLEPQFSLGHQLFQIRRWSRTAVDCRQHRLVDRERKVGTHLICVLDRAEYGEAAAEGRLDDRIYRLRVADTV